MDHRKNTVQCAIRGMSLDELKQFLLDLEARYGSNQSFHLSPNTMSSQLLTCLSMTEGTFVSISIDELQDELELEQTQANTVYSRAKELGEGYASRAKKVASDVAIFGKTLMSLKQCILNALMSAPDQHSIVLEEINSQQKCNASFKVQQYILGICSDRKYFKRHLSDRLAIYMQAKIMPDGRRSCYYERLGSIKDLIYKYTAKEVNYEMYQASSDQRVMENVLAQLSDRPHAQLPTLEPDRSASTTHDSFKHVRSHM